MNSRKQFALKIDRRMRHVPWFYISARLASTKIYKLRRFGLILR
jgi:hypothetical protein